MPNEDPKARPDVEAGGELLDLLNKMPDDVSFEVFERVLLRLEKQAAKRPLTAAEAAVLKAARKFLEAPDLRVKIAAADIQAVEKAPIPLNIWRRRRILFPAKSSSKAKIVWATIPETGEKAVVITQDLGGGKQIIRRGFIPADVSEEDLPQFGDLTDRIYKASIFLQKAQIKKTDSIAWPYISKADLMRALEFSEERIENPGKLSKMINASFMTLAYFTCEIRDKKSGQVESVAHILDWRRDMTGRGFYFKMNNDHAGLILGLLRGELPTNAYISYPRELLAALPKEKRGIFEELVSLAGLARPYPVFIRTILTRWAGLSLAEANKKKSGLALSEFLSPILDEAQEKGLIIGYSYEKKSTRNPNPLEWKVTFSFPRRKRHHDIDKDLLAAMLETWGPEASLFEAGDELEKRRAAKRRQFAATMAKHGPAVIRRCFAEAKADPTGEAAFWRLTDGL